MFIRHGVRDLNEEDSRSTRTSSGELLLEPGASSAPLARNNADPYLKCSGTDYNSGRVWRHRMFREMGVYRGH